MLRILKVTGKSLWPEYEEGDYVVLATFPFFFRFLKRGDVVVFRHPEHGTLIKKVERILPQKEHPIKPQNGSQTGPGEGTIFVVGSHPDSIDSRQFGPIRQQDLIGKVLWHVPKPGRAD